jgi:hypothetical protein
MNLNPYFRFFIKNYQRISWEQIKRIIVFYIMFPPKLHSKNASANKVVPNLLFQCLSRDCRVEQKENRTGPEKTRAKNQKKLSNHIQLFIIKQSRFLLS